MNTFYFWAVAVLFLLSLRGLVPHLRWHPCGLDLVVLAVCVLAARSFNR